MSIRSSRMMLLVPTGNTTTADAIDFRVRPHLGFLGVQTWGLTQNIAPRTYAFDIEVEGAQWQDVTDKLGVAKQMLLSTYGLEMLPA